MHGNNICSDQVIVEIIEMGFEYSNMVEAIKGVGLSVPSVVEHILNTPKLQEHNKNPLRRQPLRTCRLVRQAKVFDHFHSNDVQEHTEDFPDPIPFVLSEPFQVQDLDVASDWERKVSNLMEKHFGFSSLKSFQKEALSSWLDKSLCFRIPALLSGKVVVVISPLISLMHDQCLKLTKDGISACFLCSGQPDDTVEQKAMRGLYNIVYVCPESVLRLIQPRKSFQKVAELLYLQLTRYIVFLNRIMISVQSTNCVLRENFSASKLKSMEFDIPLMALTATATKVKDNRTSKASYAKDFVTHGEKPPHMGLELPEAIDPPKKPEGRLKFLKEPLEHGPAIIYVSTRKETLRIAKFLCKFGVKAATYNAGVWVIHFFPNNIFVVCMCIINQVIIALIAFGMGIDKLDMYFLMSLEDYCPKAGRVGQHGKFADCNLYANIGSKPSRLPSWKIEEYVDAVLEGLPQEYAPVVSVTESKFVTPPIAEVEALLLAHESRANRFRKQSFSPSINYTQG
uniref:ATP-dependent DNA helicase recQ n=1 Tax=Cajanus cajan TaxID=3821 RepID=A0A151TU19_CAJCA|nr:putative ATP-dependent DNA helicase recQ [Cajanus cajan]